MVILSLSSLGPFQAIYDDQSISSFRTSKVQASLIMLAAELGPQTGRD